jgi:hypothetical protein
MQTQQLRLPTKKVPRGKSLGKKKIKDINVVFFTM